MSLRRMLRNVRARVSRADTPERDNEAPNSGVIKDVMKFALPPVPELVEGCSVCKRMALLWNPEALNGDQA